MENFLELQTGALRMRAALDQKGRRPLAAGDL